MVFEFMRIPVVQQQIQKVHQKIYEGFLSFETIQACDDSSELKIPWAQVYNDWINHMLKDNQERVGVQIGRLSKAVAKPEITESAGQKNGYGKAIDELNLSHPAAAITGESLSFELDKILAIPVQTTLGIHRRDGTAICSTTAAGPTSAPAPTPTICPDPKPNLAKNRCDEKCMGAGWGNCDPDVKDKYNNYSCYCNDGPCGGKQCGDPVKIDQLTGKGTKCPVSSQRSTSC